MWIGSWLLAVFALVALFYAYLHLPGGWRRWPVRQPAAWRRRCALAGLPLGFAVAVYTAVLLGVLVARPLWNTPLLSVIFVLSALSSGTAALILIAPARARHVIARWDLLAIGAETLVIAALLLFGAVSSRSAHNAVALLASGDYAGLFWIGVVFAGLVVPSAIELWAARRLHPSRVATIVAAWLVLAGGFLLRFVIVYAGQQSALS
jgi:formate-dependent nitrite reductase membrane component NrfD